MTDNIPIEKLYSHPVVQELLAKIEINNTKLVDLDQIKLPFVIKDKVLMSPGVWNDFYYSNKAIHDAFLKTRWDSKEIRSLYADHEDNRTREWVGEITNPRMKGEHLIGDLVIVDKSTAQKLAYGAKMGISPKVHGVEDNNEMLEFEFDNFSVVINPAVKTAYINNMEVSQMTKEKKLEEPAVEVEEEEAPKAEDAAAEAPVEEPAPAEPAPEPAPEPVPVVENTEEVLENLPTEAKMSNEDIVNQIIKLAQMLQKDKKYPYPEEEEKSEKEADDRAKKMEETIKELSEQLDKVTAKLNEPEKKAVKTAELSGAVSDEKLVAGSLDGAMLSAFSRIGGL